MRHKIVGKKGRSVVMVWCTLVNSAIVVEQLGMQKKDLMAEYEEKQWDIVNKCRVVANNLPRMSIAFSTMTCIGSSRTVTAVVSTSTATLFFLAFTLVLRDIISPLGSHGFPDLILNGHAFLKQLG